MGKTIHLLSMPEKNFPVAAKYIYSERTINKINQLLREKIFEHRRLQIAGKLPFAKRLPKYIVEISDIMIITGKTERTAQRHMARIRKKRKKKKGQMITIKDFVLATGIDEYTVRQALNLLT